MISWLCSLDLLIAGPVFAAAPPGQGDLAAEVKAVFQAKCAECHGPRVRKPKGKFGYVLDLKKLANDPKKVVPSQPEGSKLWQLVRDDKMPPEEARAGPLTQGQKQIIHDWIAAGAPSVPTEQGAPSPADKAAEPTPPPTTGGHLLDWLGNFHVVVVHFPIALLLAAAAGEAWFAWRRVRQPAPAIRFCVLLGAASAIVAAVLGWLHAASGHGASSPVILAWHRWLGTATGAGAAGLAVLSQNDDRRGVRSAWFRLLLLVVALVVAVAGHFGGLLVYGEDYFNW
jgi:uncharacterized membrane protein/mono/diheme cytochrome c family protein